jgi:hypothetical protein
MESFDSDHEAAIAEALAFGHYHVAILVQTESNGSGFGNSDLGAKNRSAT